MTDRQDKNGYNSSDFKRNSNQEMNADMEDPQDGEDSTRLNRKAGEYMKELLNEKMMINNTKFPLSATLIDEEMTRVQTSGRAPVRAPKYLDLYREKPVKVTVRALVPVKEHPKFNFIGKLMGPKGSTMKHLQEETMCKMAVLGRGSMRDRQKEEELRNSSDPKYSHLSDELHVEITALAPPAEAHARIAYALAEVKKYLQPDMNEMWPTPMKIMERGGPSMPPYLPHQPHLHAPPARPAPRMPPAPPPLRAMPPKPNKVLSILDRARSAMETTYTAYDDGYAPPEPAPRGPRTAPVDGDFYYERRGERFYEEDSSGYFKDEAREFEPSSRDVGTRRQRHYARPAPYARAPK